MVLFYVANLKTYLLLYSYRKFI